MANSTFVWRCERLPNPPNSAVRRPCKLPGGKLLFPHCVLRSGRYMLKQRCMITFHHHFNFSSVSSLLFSVFCAVPPVWPVWPLTPTRPLLYKNCCEVDHFWRTILYVQNTQSSPLLAYVVAKVTAFLFCVLHCISWWVVINLLI